MKKVLLAEHARATWDSLPKTTRQKVKASVASMNVRKQSLKVKRLNDGQYAILVGNDLRVIVAPHDDALMIMTILNERILERLAEQ